VSQPRSPDADPDPSHANGRGALPLQDDAAPDDPTDRPGSSAAPVEPAGIIDVTVPAEAIDVATPVEPAPPSAPSGPPGSGIFTLEGRNAPGLYLVAWVLIVAGLALTLFIGPLATADAPRLILIGVGAILAALGFAAACGYQVLERRTRPRDRYRGPSPLLVFGAYFFVLAVIGLVLILAGAADPEDPLGFLAIGTIQAIGYAVVVWLVVVRTGALSWRGMGWPTWPGAGSVLASIITAVVVMLPTTFALLIAGGILAQFLGVEAPDVLPTTEDSTGALAVAAAAAVIIPIGEELFFRGFALTAWLRDLGPRAALVRSSLFFALVHIANITSTTFGEGAAQAVLQTAIILPVGAVLGWLFLRRGMAAAIGGHVAYNGLLLSLALAAGSLSSAGT
jgi:membrane protease YdiL (CAAX protease family)